MTSFLELAKKRYSSRNYQSTAIDEQKILNILEAARIAPSAANKQPYIFYVIREKENLQKIYEVYHREWYKTAPLVIVGCINKDEAWVRACDQKNHADIDIAIAIDHMTLQATSEGLATCWICNFDVEKCKKILQLPAHIEPVVILPVAYPNDIANIDSHLKNRKTIDQLVKWM